MKRRAIKQDLDWCHRTKPILSAIVQFRWVAYISNKNRYVYVSNRYEKKRSVHIHLCSFRTMERENRIIEPRYYVRSIDQNQQ